MVQLVIDDKALEAEDGATILEVALENGINIPTLCYHKDLTPYGACRLCLVEIVSGGRPSLQASCVYKVTEGLVIKTDSERVRKTRKIMLELMLAQAPNSEKIVKLAQEYGIESTRLRKRNESDCILCSLCVRVCAEVSERNAINFAERGIRRKVQTPFDTVSEVCIGCSACAYVCPTQSIVIEEA